MTTLPGTGVALLLFAAGAAFPARAQPSTGASAPSFVFATIAEAQAVLGARDDYVRATTALERSAKLRVADAVDEERFMRFMRDRALEWTDEQQRNLALPIERLARFLEGMKWRMPGRILLIQSDAALEDDSPHTRGQAIVVPASFLARGPGLMAHLLAHEMFHVLTRGNSALKERLYAAIGFRRCDTVVIPPLIARLAITNPDTVESRHTISVRYQGQPVDALPVHTVSVRGYRPARGFMKQVHLAWLLIDRRGAECRARDGAQAGGVAPQELEGLSEQVGRNTQYLFHAEEILADNFSLLFFASVSGSTQGIPSPEILERMRQILFD